MNRFLDLQQLEKSVAALRRSFAVSEDEAFMNGLNADARNTIISGVIKHFEFTYEQCWKFMKRWIEMNVGPDVVKGITRYELFRPDAENFLSELRKRNA